MMRSGETKLGKEEFMVQEKQMEIKIKTVN